MGGTAVSVSSLSSALAEQGMDVAVLAHDYAGLGPLLATGAARRCIAPARRRPFHLGARSAGFPALATREVAWADLVHSHGLWLSSNHRVARLANRLGKPLVISPRGMLESWSKNHRRTRKTLAWYFREAGILRRASAFHATSDAEADTIRQLGFSQPIFVQPNGTNLSPPRADREMLQAEFPALRNKRWMLFLSRLHVKKGLDWLLHAWAAVQPAYSDWHLVIAGGDLDGTRRQFEAIAREKNLEASVTFTGEVSGSRKASALANAEIFVLPSRSENFGNVILEALSYGLPVITTKATPWPQIAEAGCGWWIDPDLPSLERALREAMSKPMEDLRAQGIAARRIAGHDYAWAQIAIRMIPFYHQIVEDNLPPKTQR